MRETSLSDGRQHAWLHLPLLDNKPESKKNTRDASHQWSNADQWCIDRFIHGFLRLLRNLVTGLSCKHQCLLLICSLPGQKAASNCFAVKCTSIHLSHSPALPQNNTSCSQKKLWFLIRRLGGWDAHDSLWWGGDEIFKFNFVLKFQPHLVKFCNNCLYAHFFCENVV